MAINPIVFYDQLASHGVDFFTGVPDSLLKEFCLCVDDRVPNNKHVIAANEGNAIALAAGYYLAQQSLPLVYMQNSGLGNAVNPLSLVAPVLGAFQCSVPCSFNFPPALSPRILINSTNSSSVGTCQLSGHIPLSS